MIIDRKYKTLEALFDRRLMPGDYQLHSAAMPGDVVADGSPSTNASITNSPESLSAPVGPGVNIPQPQHLQGRNRARVACRRCRRLRVKCLHDHATAPCTACQKAGPNVAAECVFPPRGVSEIDREFRRGKGRARLSNTEGQSSPTSSQRGSKQKFSTALPSVAPPTARVAPVVDLWELLPPLSEVVEGCRIFAISFFQLGFIPKAIFLERLKTNPQSVNVFFLLGILSISARFTPCLITRYGDGLKAAEYFIECAANLVSEEMYVPTLERIQGFFLLAIAEWGKGDKTSSNIHMGIAVRMAGMLKLHREETYRLGETASADDIIHAEMARRTFWMLESQDNLHSGYTSPVSFSLNDITTLLPSDESDLAFGTVPAERAALAGTLIATRNPSLVHRASRSLFATLIQTHNLWGQIARRAVSNDFSDSGTPFHPWDARSDYAQLIKTLSYWEDHLPPRHRWSIWNLRGFKAEDLDLAYLSVTMVIRLCNIVLRRSFLENIIHATPDDGAPENFWKNMSIELFQNVLGLHEQIEAFFSLRSREQGYPAMIVFCVYICGSLGNHLWKHPTICVEFAPRAEGIMAKSLEVLIDLQHAWPLARRWKEALQRTASTTQMELSTSPQAAVPSHSYPAIPEVYRPTQPHSSSESHPDVGARESLTPLVGHGSLSLLAETAAQIPQHNAFAQNAAYVPMGRHPHAPLHPVDHGQQHGFGNEFDTELTAFLEAEGQLGFLYDWDQQLY